MIHFICTYNIYVFVRTKRKFKDFEDGLQYFTAIENNLMTLLTRNLKDYKTAEITVMPAEQFLKGK